MSSGLLGVGAIGLAVIAAFDAGVPTADVELHDGSVWLTNESTLMVGRLNYPSRLLDSSLRTTTSAFDVLQEGSLVLVHDESNNVLSVVDPAAVASETDVVLSRGSEIALGGGVVAIAEPEKGDVWVMRAGWLPSFDKDATPPVATLGREVAIAVSENGTVFAVSAETGRAATITIGADSSVRADETGAVELGKTDHVAVTTVGSERVVWDEDNAVLILPSGAHSEFPEGSRLQQGSASAGGVTIATPTQLVYVPFDGSDPVTTDAGGTGVPAAPVVLHGCTYAAWAGSGVFVRDCEGDAYDMREPIDGALPSSAFTFRVNRDVVVLNDSVNGAAYLVNEGLERVSNWDDLLPPPDEQQAIEDTPDDQMTETLPDRSGENTPPVAEDDAFGARAGRTTVIPVVDNDFDLDGDVLTATVVDGKGVPGRIEQIRGGAALQIALADDAAGRATFTYRVSDGRGGVDDATVTLTIASPDSNLPPESRRHSRLKLEAGATASYNVIPDWVDPDGDLLFLREAKGNGVDSIDFTPDGTITITANPEVQGTRDIEVVVSDGRVDVEGVLRIDVLPMGTQAPLTNADYVVTTVGAPVIVKPLGNDISRSAQPIRLIDVSEVRGATLVRDDAANAFTFSSTTAGTYYVQYAVTDGSHEAANLVRIDVLDAVEASLPPIAVADVALVAPGDSVLVDVLANDVDPAGGVLVVQGVDVPADSGVSVAVLEHRLVRVTNVAGITEPVTLTYRVSNGAFTSKSEITVLPIDPPSRYLAPVAQDDEVTVRAGDIASVDVLSNDIHPSGLDFSLEALAEPLADPGIAEVFVSEDVIRIKAGANPGQAKATYTVIDEMGQHAAAQLTIKIVGAEAGNSAPRPVNVTARALSGGSVRIPIPLNGIDPDGDSVSLIGTDEAPELGRVTQIGQDWLIYEAYADAQGTDRFTYVVRDGLGAEATGTVVVGVAPPEFVNHAPMCVRDDASMRPGHALSYPVLVNDSDPDSDVIALDAGGLTVPEGITASVSGNRILIEDAPEGDATLTYTVSDVYGASATCAFVVTVDPAIPAVAPIARDDRVAGADVQDDGSVVVDVLDNDEDPDGVTSRLKVSLDSLDGTVNSDGTVTLIAQAAARVVTYKVTDPDSLSASAFILVPGIGHLPPALIEGAPVEVTSGQTIDLPLGDLVTTATGNAAIITEVERVFAAHTNGDALVVDATTLRYTSADGYVGKDAISFQVTDGKTVDDPMGQRATLMLPLIVRPAGNVPPTFRNTSVVATAGGDAVGVNLALLSADANPKDVAALTWGLGESAPKGFRAKVTGAEFSISVDTDVSGGTERDIDVWVSDGTADRVHGVIRVSVLAGASTTDSGESIPVAVPIANDDTVSDAQAGKPSVVHPLRNDLNPYTDKPLEIVSTTLESGTGTLSVNGEDLTVTPGQAFSGTMIVRYTIADASGQPSRQATARVIVTVVKKPDAPGKPQLKSVGDKSAVLEWVEPPTNGSPITGYTVTSDQGTSTNCSSTICTIEGLKNDVEYRFTVIAHNGAGDSDPSPASDVARPDVHPEQPDAPVLTFGDQALDITWTPPLSQGSPIRSYTLELSPASAAGAQKTSLIGTTYHWTGLENGVAYQVKIQAYNDAVDPSSWSDPSASEIPAGVPVRVDKPTTTRLAPVGNRAQMQVAWEVPSGNGDPVGSFTVNALRGGAVVATQTVGANVTSAPFQLDPSSSDYTFVVVAHNKAGDSQTSMPSDPRRAFIAPGAPTSVTATPGDRSLTVSYAPGAANGSDAGWISYQYELNGNGSWNTMPGGGVITGLGNGTSYTVKLRAITTADGATYTGSVSSASPAQVPFGAIGAASVSASSGSGQVTFHVTAPATNGRPITLIEYRQKSGAGGAWSGWSNVGITSGSTDLGLATSGPGATNYIEVRVWAQDTGSPSTASGSGASYPRRSWVTKGAAAPAPNASQNFLVVNWSEFQTGSYTVKCRTNRGDTYIGTYTYTVNATSSSGAQQLLCRFGYPGDQAYISWTGGPGAPFDSDTLTW